MIQVLRHTAQRYKNVIEDIWDSLTIHLTHHDTWCDITECFTNKHAVNKKADDTVSLRSYLKQKLTETPQFQVMFGLESNYLSSISSWSCEQSCYKK